MPPALSDDDMESDGPDMIPAKGIIPTKADVEDQAKGAEEDESEEDGEEYRVEKIIKHGFDDKGATIYQIKWLGYEDEDDQTWEPLENLGNASELLNEYHAKIGGPPQPPSKGEKKKGPKGGKGGKRSAASAFTESPSVDAATKKRGRKSAGASNGAAWTPPDGTWEDNVTRVSSIIEDNDDPAATGTKITGKKNLYALLEWNDGRKTQFPLDVIRRKCPQRLLDYYEQHLVFKSGGTEDIDE